MLRNEGNDEVIDSYPNCKNHIQSFFGNAWFNNVPISSKYKVESESKNPEKLFTFPANILTFSYKPRLDHEPAYLQILLKYFLTN